CISRCPPRPTLSPYTTLFRSKLQTLLPLIDWIGLDIKTSKNDYQLITRTKDSGNAAWQSAELVINSGVSHQLRITAHPSWLADSDAQWIRRRLLDMGAESVVIQTGALGHN